MGISPTDKGPNPKSLILNFFFFFFLHTTLAVRGNKHTNGKWSVWCGFEQWNGWEATIVPCLLNFVPLLGLNGDYKLNQIYKCCKVRLHLPSFSCSKADRMLLFLFLSLVTPRWSAAQVVQLTTTCLGRFRGFNRSLWACRTEAT